MRTFKYKIGQIVIATLIEYDRGLTQVIREGCSVYHVSLYTALQAVGDLLDTFEMNNKTASSFAELVEA